MGRAVPALVAQVGAKNADLVRRLRLEKAKGDCWLRD